MAELIRGRQLADTIQKKVAARISKLSNPPGLAAILVGDDNASHLYVSLKEKAAKDAGIYFEKFIYPADAKEKTIIQKIRELNKRSDINGILVQLPLPGQDEDAIIAEIDPDKDVDGFHPMSRKRLAAHEPGLVPPVSLAIMKLISSTRQPLKGKHAVIVANHPVFAEPLIELFKEVSCAAVFVPRKASALTAKLNVADILVVAVGKRGFIQPDMVKDGAIVIDVGTNKTAAGGMVGDVSREAAQKAGFKSPVPGGVGPLTVAYLLQNILKAATLQNR